MGFMEEFCTSVVVGKDAVPRMSVNNLNRLMDEMVTSLARCRLAPPLFTRSANGVLPENLICSPHERPQGPPPESTGPWLLLHSCCTGRAINKRCLWS